MRVSAKFSTLLSIFVSDLFDLYMKIFYSKSKKIMFIYSKQYVLMVRAARKPTLAAFATVWATETYVNAAFTLNFLARTMHRVFSCFSPKTS